MEEANNHKEGRQLENNLKDQLDLVPETNSITLGAIGDILIHGRVYRDAEVSNGYDFMPMLKPVEPYLTEPTITTANQETMIGGEAFGLSSYPAFNSPVEVADALKISGIDLVSLANNHTLDRGEDVIREAISYWNEIDIPYTGAYQSEADREQIRIIQTEAAIDVAFLSYTYGTNGIPTPEGKSYLVNRIDREQIASDVAKAKEASDVIVMQLHFGSEYERMPNQEQQDLVQYVADLGVDIVIGHHSHVLQPVEWVEGKDGGKTFVVYSLGNFLSGQDTLYRRIGGMIEVTIEKKVEKGEQKITITSPKFLATFVDYSEQTDSDYQVVPMYQLTEAQLENHDQHYQEIKAHMSQWMPELTFLEE